MKNNQKILSPCTPAFILSFSAFVSADDNSSLEYIKEQLVSEAWLFSANGSDVVSSSVAFNTTRTVFQKEKSQSLSVVENKVVGTLINSETLDVNSIVESYK